MTIKGMIKEITTAQDTMMNIKDLGAKNVIKGLIEQIENAYTVMRPMK